MSLLRSGGTKFSREFHVSDRRFFLSRYFARTNFSCLDLFLLYPRNVKFNWLELEHFRSFDQPTCTRSTRETICSDVYRSLRVIGSLLPLRLHLLGLKVYWNDQQQLLTTVQQYWSYCLINFLSRQYYCCTFQLSRFGGWIFSRELFWRIVSETSILVILGT